MFWQSNVLSLSKMYKFWSKAYEQQRPQTQASHWQAISFSKSMFLICTLKKASNGTMALRQAMVRKILPPSMPQYAFKCLMRITTMAFPAFTVSFMVLYMHMPTSSGIIPPNRCSWGEISLSQSLSDIIGSLWKFPRKFAFVQWMILCVWFGHGFPTTELCLTI